MQTQKTQNFLISKLYYMKMKIEKRYYPSNEDAEAQQTPSLDFLKFKMDIWVAVCLLSLKNANFFKFGNNCFLAAGWLNKGIWEVFIILAIKNDLEWELEWIVLVAGTWVYVCVVYFLFNKTKPRPTFLETFLIILSLHSHFILFFYLIYLNLTNITVNQTN